MSTMFISGVHDLAKAGMIIAAIIVVVGTFIDTNIGLVLILMSMLLSPELEVGATPGRAIVIRAEDLLLILVSVTWLAKMALKKELPFIRRSPLNAPIGIFCAVLLLSTLLGMMTGSVSPLKGMFYVLKLIEYFVLYLIVLNHTTSPRQVTLFLTVLIITALIVGVYCNATIGRVDRISAPFEGEGEPNTLGGYLLFVLCVIGGLVLYKVKYRGYLFLVFAFLIPTFIFTLSRASYLGVLPAIFVFAALAKDKRVLGFLLAMIAGAMLLVALGPPALKDRVVGAFQPEQRQELKQVGLIKLGPSPAARVMSWKNVMTRKFPQKPFLGHGVTGAGFLDSQYFLVLAENGAIGVLAFFWLMWRIWKAGIASFRSVERPSFKGLTVGYLAGFIGLLVHAIGSNSFVIIRIAEPFWFFTAIIVKLSDIETGKARLEDDLPKYARYRL